MNTNTTKFVWLSEMKLFFVISLFQRKNPYSLCFVLTQNWRSLVYLLSFVFYVEHVLYWKYRELKEKNKTIRMNLFFLLLFTQGCYMTIHITPEPEFSYVSFESNVASEDYSDLISRVIKLFQPGKFLVTIFVSKVCAHQTYALFLCMKNLNWFHFYSFHFLHKKKCRHQKRLMLVMNWTIKHRLANGSVVTFNIVVFPDTIWLMRTIRNSQAEGYRMRPVTRPYHNYHTTITIHRLHFQPI